MTVVAAATGRSLESVDRKRIWVEVTGVISGPTFTGRVPRIVPGLEFSYPAGASNHGSESGVAAADAGSCFGVTKSVTGSALTDDGDAAIRAAARTIPAERHKSSLTTMLSPEFVIHDQLCVLWITLCSISMVRVSGAGSSSDCYPILFETGRRVGSSSEMSTRKALSRKPSAVNHVGTRPDEGPRVITGASWSHRQMSGR